MTKFFWRLTGAAMLNPAVYEDVESDSSATVQAFTVVLMSSLAAGVGILGPDRIRPLTLVVVSLMALALWVVWAVLTFEIGARIIPSSNTHATPGELLRTIGFATAPGLFRLIAAVAPGVRFAVFAVTAVWMLAAMIVAVRQALDYTSTLRAVVVCGLGWTLAMGFVVIAGIFFGPSLN